MNNRTDILNELTAISPLLAGIGNGNVFSVPEGYFDSISPTVLLSVKVDDPVKEEGSSVPEGYFDGLAVNILNKIKSQANESADEMPAVFSQINKQQPFIVTAGYFESFGNNVLAFLKNDDADIIPPVLQEKINTASFEVPHGYFETLSVAILSKIKLDEKESMPLIFERISKSNPFEVPQGYFENLSYSVLTKVKTSNVGKVVKMPVRFNIFKYAAAAMLTGALALGIYKFSGNGSTIKPFNQTAALDPSIQKGKAMDDKSFNESLDNLSEEAIVKYLEKNGSDADVSVLTSNLQNTVLPEEEDYLLDDNTLDDFLKELKNNTN